MKTNFVPQQQAEWPRPPETLRLQIDGLRPIQIDGKQAFELDGVRVVAQVDWQKVQTVLVDSGVEEREAVEYIEEFAELVFQKELARALAKRVRMI